MKTYAGIGSRNTPDFILRKMFSFAKEMSKENYTLYSGGAEGADTAFEIGATSKKIFLPWNGFNGHYINNTEYFLYTDAAWDMASKYHPKWNSLKIGAKKLHARNCHQILGLSLNEPVEFVMCYTENGLLKGGTAQALRIAKDFDIPVYNYGFKG